MVGCRARYRVEIQNNRQMTLGNRSSMQMLSKPLKVTIHGDQQFEPKGTIRKTLMMWRQQIQEFQDTCSSKMKGLVMLVLSTTIMSIHKMELYSQHITFYMSIERLHQTKKFDWNSKQKTR